MNNIEPLFSVLIANFNNGRYLQEAIDSVLEQTYHNWEIILVDDGSTDNSFEIYKKYETDERFKFYYNEVNRGCGFTKKRCAELANGEICGFLDADDALLPHALEIMVNFHNANPNTALVFSRFYYCSENLKIVRESRILMIEESESYFSHRDYQQEVFSTFKSEFYRKTDGITSLYPLGIDQDLYFKLEEVGGLLIIKDITYKFRLHMKSISNDYLKALYWNFEVRRDTCLRRGYNIHEFLLPDFKLTIEKYVNDSFERGSNMKEVEIRSSKTYKVGKLIKSLITKINLHHIFSDKIK